MRLQVLVCLGRVVKIDTSDEADQVLSVRILSGQFRGETVQVNNVWTGRAFGDRVLHKGDVLFLDIPLRDPMHARKLTLYPCASTSEPRSCYIWRGC